MVAKAPIPVAVPWVNDGDIVVAAAVGRTVETVDTRRVAVVDDDVLNIGVSDVVLAVVVVGRHIGVGVTLRVVGVALRVVRIVSRGGCCALHCNNLCGRPHAINVVDIDARSSGREKDCAGAEGARHNGKCHKSLQCVYECFHFNFLQISLFYNIAIIL